MDVLVEVDVTVGVGEHPPTVLVTGLEESGGTPQGWSRSVSLALFMIVEQD